DTLTKLWEAIQQASSCGKKAPFLIYQESDVLLCTIRDYLRDNIKSIIVDTKEAYFTLLEHIKRLRPDFEKKLKLYTNDTPIFSRYGIEEQFSMMYQRDISLPSGGVIVIDRTEALTAVDINSAKSTKGSDIEETAVQTNVEAAVEIARQLRLRDIGGLVVIDFIDMMNPANQKKVEVALAAALKQDRARVRIGRISKFGLLEMSRQRLSASLGESHYQLCQRCDGRGFTQSIESVSLRILRDMEEKSIQPTCAEMVLHAPIEVATYLINESKQTIAEFEEKNNVAVIIIPNKYMQSPEYDLQCVRKRDKNTHSYTLVKRPEEKEERVSENPRDTEEPLIKNVRHANRSKKEGLFTRFWHKLFTTDEQQAANATLHTSTGRKQQPKRPHKPVSGAKTKPRTHNDRTNTNSNRNVTTRKPNLHKDVSRNKQTTVNTSTSPTPTVKPLSAVVEKTKDIAASSVVKTLDDGIKKNVQAVVVANVPAAVAKAPIAKTEPVVKKAAVAKPTSKKLHTKHHMAIEVVELSSNTKVKSSVGNNVAGKSKMKQIVSDPSLVRISAAIEPVEMQSTEVSSTKTTASVTTKNVNYKHITTSVDKALNTSNKSFAPEVHVIGNNKKDTAKKS
ncbi:MAG: hypothetical protein COB50_02655, partial [Thiotrichales bacterium]